MKLYVIAISPTSRKVLGVIHHLKIDVEIVELEAFSGSTKAPNYLELNPNGFVPTLVDGDLKLWESCAILKYLSDLYPDNDLTPKDIKSQADMWRWIHWESIHFTKALSKYFWESFVKPHYGLGETNFVDLENNLKDIYMFSGVLEKHLEGKKFIMGENLTLADFAVGSISEHQRRGNIPFGENYPNLLQWFDRLEKIPAWQKCFPTFDRVNSN